MAPRCARASRPARYPLVCFTDGDRQFRIADLGALLRRLDETDAQAWLPDVVVGYRIKRADPAIRLAYARVYRACLRLFFGLRVRDPDCACKLFRREALEGVRVESGGAFLSAELLIKIGERGGVIVEQGVPHYPRTAGRASGADPRVVLRAVRDFWSLRLRLWATEAQRCGAAAHPGPADATRPERRAELGAPLVGVAFVVGRTIAAAAGRRAGGHRERRPPAGRGEVGCRRGRSPRPARRRAS